MKKSMAPSKLFINLDDLGCCAYPTEKLLIDDTELGDGDLIAEYSLSVVKKYSLQLIPINENKKQD